MEGLGVSNPVLRDPGAGPGAFGYSDSSHGYRHHFPSIAIAISSRSRCNPMLFQEVRGGGWL